MKNDIKIGDVIYYRDTGWEGNIHQAGRVVGETSRSWLVLPIQESFGLPAKLPKNLKGFELGTERDYLRQKWAFSNLPKLRKTLDYFFYNSDKIIEIAKVLGEPIPEELEKGL